MCSSLFTVTKFYGIVKSTKIYKLGNQIDGDTEDEPGLKKSEDKEIELTNKTV